MTDHGDGRDVVTPLELERIAPYANVIRNVVYSLGNPIVTPWLMAAIGFRESHFGWALTYEPKGDPFGLGDGGHGFGLWQLDNRWNQHRIDRVLKARKQRDDLYAIGAMCQEAIGVLVEKVVYLSSPRRPKPLFGDLLRRAAIAAYNAGEGAVYKRYMQRWNIDDVDLCTADGPDRDKQGDYSAWVLAKEAAVRKAAPNLFPVEAVP